MLSIAILTHAVCRPEKKAPKCDSTLTVLGIIYAYSNSFISKQRIFSVNELL